MKRIKKNRGIVIREYYTADQAAKFLGYSYQTLNNFRTNNIGPEYFKVGRSIRYKHEDLVSFIESQKKIKTFERMI